MWYLVYLWSQLKRLVSYMMDPQLKSPDVSEDEGRTPPTSPRCKRAIAAAQHTPSPPRHVPGPSCAANKAAADSTLDNIHATLISMNGRLTALEHSMNEMLTLLRSLTPSMPRTISTKPTGPHQFMKIEV